ncbi:MAG TPA: glycosyltransferase [Methanospirillum sp.]|nr:glycosyltransferase [Methanospirillum sp.]
MDFKIPGGAERFFIDMARALNATIVCLSVSDDFCTIYPDAAHVRFCPLHKTLPGEPLFQLAGMMLFKRLHLDYDFYIATDDMALRFLSKKIPHTYLMLTPRRALYDMYYPTLASLPPGKREIFRIILAFFRYLDQRYVKKHVRCLAGISHTVRTRIWKAYQKPATVIYPPIHIEKYQNKGYGTFWLSVSRIDKWKRIDLQIDAFRLLPDKKLVIAGKIYPEYEYLVREAPQNVTFLGPVPDEELLNLYGSCRGFLTTAIDEDYGLTPLEAMACEKPVVAVCEGGYQETVTHAYTGFLVAPASWDIAEAIRMVDTDPSRFGPEARRKAEQFDYKIFKEQLATYVHTCLHEYRTDEHTS